MFKTILVPIDTSHAEVGTAALTLAGDIAKVRSGKIVVLNMVETMPKVVAMQLSSEIHDQALIQTKKDISNILKSVNMNQDSVEVVIRDGHVGRGILEYARDFGAELIVIASHDPGLADYVLGSVAAHVVRHAHCSVLVARNLP